MTEALGQWFTRRVDLSSVAGSVIYQLAVVDCNEAQGAAVTQVRRVHLIKGSGEVIPLFCNPASWQVDTNPALPTGAHYELTNPNLMGADWDLIKLVANLLRPVGEWVALYPMFEHYSNFKVDAPFFVSSGIDGLHELVSDEEGLHFPAEGGRALSSRQEAMRGEGAYSLSAKVVVPYTGKGLEHYYTPPEGVDGDQPVRLSMVFAKESPYNYYAADLYFNSGIVSLYRCEYGDRVMVAQGGFDLRGFVFRVSAILEGALMLVTVDGQTVLEYRDTQRRLTGSWELRGGPFILKELTVTPIPTEREVVP